MASKLLFQRISDAIYERTRLGKADVTPTLFDLERTHILYVNAHFKPYAAIGYEYSVTKPSSGTTTLGGSVQFSIPQFGDFFHDMVARVQIGAATANSQATPNQNTTAFPNSNVADTSGTIYNLVDAFGITIVGSGGTATTYRNLVRYCEHPGDRIFSKVKFDVNGNNLDEYTQTVSVMLNKFTVMPHKRSGFDRMNGQQVPVEGLSAVNACTVTDYDSSTAATVTYAQADAVTKAATVTANLPASTTYNTPNTIGRVSNTQSYQTALLYAKPAQTTHAAIAGITNYNNNNGLIAGNTNTVPSFLVGDAAPTVSLVNATSASALAASAINAASANTVGVLTSKHVTDSRSLFNMSQKLEQYVNGPQTPKPTQPALELWHKLKFWFNDDVRLSVPSVSIPYGQRFITMDLVASSSLIYEVPSLFLEAVRYVDIAGAAFAAQAAGHISNNTRSNEFRTYTPIFQRAGLAAEPTLTIELYINNIFVNPEVHDIFIARIGFALVRVYRTQSTNVSATTNEILLSALKWPVEYMFIGVQPTFNVREAATTSHQVTSGNVNTWRDWHRMTRQLEASCDQLVHQSSSTVSSSFRTALNPTKYYVPVSTVDTLSLVSHGIAIYNAYSDSFFNAYQPFHYGTCTIVTPEDTGAFFVNMALFPRTYQPSGHLNISRVRETYLNITSTYCSANTACVALIVAICINFILISDGSAVLRFTT